MVAFLTQAGVFLRNYRILKVIESIVLQDTLPTTENNHKINQKRTSLETKKKTLFSHENDTFTI